MVSAALRQERLGLARRLRDGGRSWGEIASALRRRWPELTALAAMRLAHGWTQQDVADQWTRHWPHQARGSKEISLWENWPTGTGRRPSLAVLDQLAEVYQCSVADLLIDVYDHRHLDPATTDRSLTTYMEMGPGVADPASVPATLERVRMLSDGMLGRREFLAGTGAVAAAAFVGSPSIGGLAVD